MLNHDLRVGNYARVSGDKQAKDDTIASQLEAVTQRVASAVVVGGGRRRGSAHGMQARSTDSEAG